MSKEKITASGQVKESIDSVFQIKNQIENLKKSLEVAKMKAEPFIEEGKSFETTKGIAYFVKGSSYMKINKNKLINVLSKAMKLTPENIQNLIKASSTQQVLEDNIRFVATNK